MTNKKRQKFIFKEPKSFWLD